MNKKFIGFIIISLLFLQNCSDKVEYLPDSFFGLSLTKTLSGKDAAEFVNRLHFGNVAAESNEIGFYKAAKGSAIIYVSYYQDSEQAKYNLDLMVEKISPENSVFTGGESFELNDTRVYRYLGMGQTHFIFFFDNALFWLSGEVRWAEKFLQEYLHFIN